MASSFVHAIVDLMTFGRHHFDLHQWKDQPARRLGPRHRIKRHQWYCAYREEWDDQDPFPRSLSQVVEQVGNKYGDYKAERYMSWASHDYLDRIWNGMSKAERDEFTVSCIWILFHSDALRSKFGVDVDREKIERTINGTRIWEDATGLRVEYVRLLRYVSGVLKNSPSLKRMLHHYG